ncbi:MAG: exodeoxyribonuclease VII small subunit [Gemmatimonadaceae bacterium]
MSYEEDMARIETIVAELGRDDVALDRALALFEEGVQRLRSASTALERAEAQVRVLIQRADGTFELGHFDG